MLRYLITLQAPDRQGLVEQLAHAVSRHGGNWLDSEMRHIDGVFAAMLVVEVPALKWDELVENIECIEGLTLTHCKLSSHPAPQYRCNFQFVAYDRPGLVLDISNKINKLGINIEQFSSQYDAAGHTGVPLFKASFGLGMADKRQEDALRQALYELGDDVILDKV
ncbi:glycine cleavage system protein R [Shewanella sp. GXUN23E]|uniref:glycine cleavage system protein R n=1 Tax=Shewanella sp. GXUN23E TaxID=3422498 RepID=UPI003D7E7E24